MRSISYLEFKNIVKRYKNNKEDVLKGLTFSVEKGEFVVILGPSGSGKSTLLEILCGFERLNEGTITLDGKILNPIEPKDRDISMVFQNYALLPHLNCYDNIAFGMKLRGVGKEEIRKKVMWSSQALDITSSLEKKPKELSGGQRQRVALARAIVREPKLFLMDEPLSNLDAKIRNTSSNIIKKLHGDINGTIIYVTHDQGEGLTLGDKIVILNEGEIQQIGTPREVYNEPKNLFVATFIGNPQINLIPVKVQGEDCLFKERFLVKKEILGELEEGKEYIIGVRAEHTKVVDKGLEGRVEKVEFLGSEVILHLNCYGETLALKYYGEEEYKQNDIINVSFDFNKGNVFDVNTKANIKEMTK